MFPLIAKRLGNWPLDGVRRFAEAWEREASLRLRDGDVMALADYQAHGRIYEGPQDRVYDDAVDLCMADTRPGKRRCCWRAATRRPRSWPGWSASGASSAGQIPGARRGHAARTGTRRGPATWCGPG